MVKSQIANLTFYFSFGYNLCFKYPNGSCKPILNIYVLRALHWYKELFNPMRFDPWNWPLKIWKSIGTLSSSNSQSGSPLGSVWVHSLTFSYTPYNMKCDSHVSFLAHTFASPYLGHEPKARVTTHMHIDKYFKTMGMHHDGSANNLKTQVFQTSI
jgi:hypothetical protein